MKKTIAILALALTATTAQAGQAYDKNILKAHFQYVDALKEGHRGNRSSYLERAGKTKGDDYRNCKEKGFYKSVDSSKYQDFDAHNFCAWHAEIGQWQYR
jgi:hypothetical protein